MSQVGVRSDDPKAPWFGWTASVITEIILPGVGAWIVPPGVTRIFVEAYGTGGPGRGDMGLTGGGGGGGGAFASKNLIVVPGESLDYNMGGGTDTELCRGWADPLVRAAAGQAGVDGGEGGLAADCIGDVIFGGGDGALGGVPFGGGGGSAAGPASAGNDAVDRIGGAAVAGGGPSGDGGLLSDDGVNGGDFGGGGGGASVGGLGGSAGIGCLRISY